MKKIIRFTASDMKYGGNIYETAIDDVVDMGDDYLVYFPLSKYTKKINKYILLPMFYINLFKKSFSKFDVGIYSLECCFFLSKKRKNIVLVHHYDPSYSNFFSFINQKITYFSLIRNKNKVDCLVVVSQYWKRFFESKGFSNVKLAYNYIDEIKKYNEYEIKDFSDKNKLSGKKIIYIGNSHIKKGGCFILDEYKQRNIKNDYIFVTSGYEGFQSYSSDYYKHFNLCYEDYLKLLQVANVVVTNSQFKEGWCRTAHEAILLGTPVIGTGFGGMQELLENSNQAVFNNYESYLSQIIKIENNKVNPSLLDKFNKINFQKNWYEIIYG